MSAEEEEALRQMQEESGAHLPDRRSEGDPEWMANGAQIELFGLQAAKALNGQRAEIIGFDDEVRRYRVRLHDDGAVKVVAKKNLRLLPPPQPQAETAVQAYGNGASDSRGSLQLGPQSRPAPPTRDVVGRTTQRVEQEIAVMVQRCQARARGGAAEANTDICDAFLRINTSVEIFEEVLKMYQTENGNDEELSAAGAATLERYEACVELYYSVRTWTEMAQDEWNLTQHSIRKHGLLGTLKNEAFEVGKDVVDLSGQAGDVIRTSSQTVPHLVRSATTTVGTVVQTGTTIAATTAGGFAERSQRHATTMLEDQVLGPVKRAWHLLLTAFLLCFLIPLFGLRTYAPLNSVVSNLGLVYAMVMVCCPPRGVQRRATKAGLLLLYPLLTVALPLSLHYWATHPSLLPAGGPSWPSLPTPPWAPLAEQPPSQELNGRADEKGASTEGDSRESARKGRKEAPSAAPVTPTTSQLSQDNWGTFAARWLSDRWRGVPLNPSGSRSAKAAQAFAVPRAAAAVNARNLRRRVPRPRAEQLQIHDSVRAGGLEM